MIKWWLKFIIFFMTYDFSLFTKRQKEIEEWLSAELASIRTGRASSTLLDSVMVESYGTKMPINQLATVTTEDARSLKIIPWDYSQMKAIERAIEAKDLGVSVVSGDTGLRVSFPEVTGEGRTRLIKLANEKLEEAKVSLKLERDKQSGQIQDLEKKGEISEDERFRLKEELQKLVDQARTIFEEMGKRKEKEILS